MFSFLLPTICTTAYIKSDEKNSWQTDICCKNGHFEPPKIGTRLYSYVYWHTICTKKQHIICFLLLLYKLYKSLLEKPLTDRHFVTKRSILRHIKLEHAAKAGPVQWVFIFLSCTYTICIRLHKQKTIVQQKDQMSHSNSQAPPVDRTPLMHMCVHRCTMQSVPSRWFSKIPQCLWDLICSLFMYAIKKFDPPQQRGSVGFSRNFCKDFFSKIWRFFQSMRIACVRIFCFGCVQKGRMGVIKSLKLWTTWVLAVLYTHPDKENL